MFIYIIKKSKIKKLDKNKKIWYNIYRRIRNTGEGKSIFCSLTIWRVNPKSHRGGG